MRWNELRGLFQAFVLVLISIGAGMTGFMTIEEYDGVDAFYMTVITLSTVGYAEVEPLSAAGKIFTSIYILFNFSIFAYFVSIFTAYVMEGKLRLIFKQMRKEQELDRLRDHIIVCGFGRNGARASEELRRGGFDFIVVDQDLEMLEQERNRVGEGFRFIADDATDDDVLRRARVEHARALITTLPRDAENVFITLTAREMNDRVTIIARASDERSVSKLRRAGANHVVMPDAIGGLHMANLITRPEVIELLDVFTGVSSSAPRKLEEIRADDLKPEYQDKTLRQLNIRALTGATVIGVKNAHEEFEVNPRADTRIGRHDVLIFFGTLDEIERTKELFCG
ncbi:MAG: potassium channel protein [Catalinimonas sp.]